jgi:hypothetical protein
MKAKELVELAGDPRFISGIYNYCDRWWRARSGSKRWALNSRSMKYTG